MKKIIIIIICMFLPFLSIAQSTEEQLFEQAKSYYNANEYEKAYPLYLELANNGNAEAQCVMGHYYLYGYSPVKENYAKAYEWYKKAADKGNARAMNVIGYMYENGYYLTQSKEKAFEYFLKASDAGDAYGSANAARMYYYSHDESFPPIDKTKSYASVPNYYSGVSGGVSSKESEDSYETKKNRHEIVHEDESFCAPVLDSNGKLNLNIVPASPAEELFLLAARQDSARGLFWLADYYAGYHCGENFLHYRGLDIVDISGKVYGGDFRWENLDNLYKIAAKHGCGEAQAVLGAAYILSEQFDEALLWLEKSEKEGVEYIPRMNNSFKVKAAIAVCKHFRNKQDYHLLTGSECMGDFVSVVDNYLDINSCVYFYVENSTGKIGIIKTDKDGNTISRTPIKYDEYGDDKLDKHIEWKEDGCYFDKIKL